MGKTSYSTASSRRGSRVVNHQYGAIARATQQRIAWPQILRNPAWRWLENNGEFSLYAIEHKEYMARPFSVLATGVVQGSVEEIASLLTSSSQDEHSHKMIGLHDKDFKHGQYIADVNTEGVPSLAAAAPTDPTAHLSIRTATFAGQNILRRDGEWCYLDSSRLDHDHQVFQKLMTSLRIEDILTAGDIRKAKLGGGKTVTDVICGYRIEAEDPNALTSAVGRDGKTPHGPYVRVEFFAEYAPSAAPQKHGTFRRFSAAGKHDATMKAVQQRLLGIARNCDRMPLLVRRRRLGVQVLMDTRRALSLANRQCINCAKSLRLAKLCRVCGNAVCKNCSDKYERESHRPHTSVIRLESVRVCDPCMTQIDSGDFSKVDYRSLFGPAVVPDPVNDTDEHSSRHAGKNLKTLLHDALLAAPSPQRKDALISVIRCVLDQEDDGPGTRPRIKSTLSTTSSTGSVHSEQELIRALDSFTLPHVPYAEADLSGQHGRSYSIDPTKDRTFPMPDNEAERLRAISDTGVLAKPQWDELDIICDLAAKELGAFASIVSVITEDEQRVVAANQPHFRAMHTARENSFCAHTIMESRPLIVPHPEADFRISHIARKWNLGLGFYCGFPLKAEDDTVIGTLCCVDKQTHELTESQYSAMERLAQTATKIIRVEAKKRRPTVVEEES